MRPRDKIDSYISYSDFLLARGFTKKETRILAKAWYRLEEYRELKNKGGCGTVNTSIPRSNSQCEQGG